MTTARKEVEEHKKKVNAKFFGTGPKDCERCGKKNINCYSQSWWTDELICGSCQDDEQPMKAALRRKGHIDAMEGCGYIPHEEMEL